MGKRKRERIEALQNKFRRLQEEMILLQNEKSDIEDPDPIPDGANGSDSEDEGSTIEEDIKENVDTEIKDSAESSPKGVEENEKTEDLDPDIEAILGEDPLLSQALNAKLHTRIHNLWKYWFANGITKVDRDELLKRYKCPTGLESPKLNPEIELKLPKHSKARDVYMCKRQQMAGSALTSIGWVITKLIEEKESVDKLFLIDRLNDATKLLVDMMNSQTKSRIALLVAGVDKDTKTILEKTSPDEFLFGKNLSDRIKEAKSLDKVASTLRGNSFQNNRRPLRQNLNSMGLPGRHFPYQAGNRIPVQHQPGSQRPRLVFRYRSKQPVNQQANQIPHQQGQRPRQHQGTK